MMNLTTTQPIQGQLPSSIKNVNSNNSLHLNSNYPLGLMPLATQIGGHGSEGDGQRPILKREDGKILKPIQPPPKGPREANFYLGQAHHMFSRFLNLQFFSRNLLCFV